MNKIESDGERNRGIYILKSRGMAHSNQVREFRLTDQGIELIDVYLDTDGSSSSGPQGPVIRDEAECASACPRPSSGSGRWSSAVPRIPAQIDALTAEARGRGEGARRAADESSNSER